MAKSGSKGVVVKIVAGGSWGTSPLPKDSSLVTKLTSLILEDYKLLDRDEDSIEVIPHRREGGFSMQMVYSKGGQIIDILEYGPVSSVSDIFRKMIRIYEDYVAWNKLSPEEQQRILDED